MQDEVQRPPVAAKGELRRVDVRLLRPPPEGIAAPAGLREFAQALAPGFYLDVGNVCNQSCIYCAVPRERSYRTTAAQARRLVAAAAAYGFRTCILIGGEPTIWPPLEASLAAMAGEGVENVILTTNGLMLAYAPLLERLRQRNVRQVGLSYDDFDPAIQAALCRREDSPSVLAAALENLRTADCSTYFYTVVTAFMKGRGEAFGRALRTLAAGFRHKPAFFFAAFKPVAAGDANLDRLEITLADTAAEIAAAIAVLGDDFVTAYRDLPLCLLPGQAGHSMDLFHANASLELDSGEIKPSCLAADRSFAPVCAACVMQGWCPGIYRSYLERHGDAEFRAFQGRTEHARRDRRS
jgi:uncharacterized Fe-S cluster-containing radical SAM superfamily protein